MCIKRVTAWAYNGHNYPTELEAVEANIKTIGDSIIKQHSDHPRRGLIANGPELAALLIRYGELKAEEGRPAESPEGTHEEEPEGTHVPGAGEHTAILREAGIPAEGDGGEHGEIMRAIGHG